MEIELHEITVGDLVEDFDNDGEKGVVGYGGRLDVRPPFQREFVYSPQQERAVIDTINRGFPLNVMYWAERIDGDFEIIDGQQRTMSVCRYVTGEFSVDEQYFHNLTDDKKNRILDYELMVYVCNGEDSEKLEWFKIINLAGEKLTDQELRNAVYAGPWLSDAKRYFSKPICPAYEIGRNYVKGRPIRQDFLETAIRWAARGDIEGYMAKHQLDEHAEPLWDHFRAVIKWVEATFITYRKAMKSVHWGPLYDAHKDDPLDPAAVESEVQRLIEDEDVESHAGIYSFILTGDEKHLSIRAFSDKVKQRVFQKQGGKCAVCGDEFKLVDMEADHITPWSEGGSTVEENCQMLCKHDNRRKGPR